MLGMAQYHKILLPKDWPRLSPRLLIMPNHPSHCRLHVAGDIEARCCAIHDLRNLLLFPAVISPAYRPHGRLPNDENPKLIVSVDYPTARYTIQKFPIGFSERHINTLLSHAPPLIAYASTLRGHVPKPLISS